MNASNAMSAILPAANGSTGAASSDPGSPADADQFANLLDAASPAPASPPEPSEPSDASVDLVQADSATDGGDPADPLSVLAWLPWMSASAAPGQAGADGVSSNAAHVSVNPLIDGIGIALPRNNAGRFTGFGALPTTIVAADLTPALPPGEPGEPGVPVRPVLVDVPPIDPRRGRFLPGLTPVLPGTDLSGPPRAGDRRDLPVQPAQPLNGIAPVDPLGALRALSAALPGADSGAVPGTTVNASESQSAASMAAAATANAAGTAATVLAGAAMSSAASLAATATADAAATALPGTSASVASALGAMNPLAPAAMQDAAPVDPMTVKFLDLISDAPADERGERVDVRGTSPMFTPHTPRTDAATARTTFELSVNTNGTQAFADNVAEGVESRLQWMAERGIGRAQIRLSPAELGTIDIQLQMDGKHVRAEFISANADVRQALESQLPRLREMFQNQGMTLTQADVGQRQDAQADAQGGRPRDTFDGFEQPAGGTMADGDAARVSSVMPQRSGLLDEYA